MDDVLSTVAPAGVTADHLVGIDTGTFVVSCLVTPAGCTRTLKWSFRLAFPLSKLRETLDAVARIRPARSSDVSISFSIETNAPSAAPECPYPTLVSQARHQAERIAAAASLRVGRVIALSDTPHEPPAEVRIPTVLGIPLTVTGLLASLEPEAPSVCATVVQFELLR